MSITVDCMFHNYVHVVLFLSILLLCSTSHLIVFRNLCLFRLSVYFCSCYVTVLEIKALTAWLNQHCVRRSWKLTGRKPATFLVFVHSWCFSCRYLFLWEKLITLLRRINYGYPTEAVKLRKLSTHATELTSLQEIPYIRFYYCGGGILSPYKKPLPAWVTVLSLIAVGRTVRAYVRGSAVKTGSLASRLSMSLKVTGIDTDRSATYDFLVPQ